MVAGALAFRHQDISNHDNDYIKWVSPGLIRGRISITLACEYGEMTWNVNTCLCFFWKKLARKELNQYQ